MTRLHPEATRETLTRLQASRRAFLPWCRGAEGRIGAMRNGAARTLIPRTRFCLLDDYLALFTSSSIAGVSNIGANGSKAIILHGDGVNWKCRNIKMRFFQVPNYRARHYFTEALQQSIWRLATTSLVCFYFVVFYYFFTCFLPLWVNSASRPYSTASLNFPHKVVFSELCIVTRALWRRATETV